MIIYVPPVWILERGAIFTRMSEFVYWVECFSEFSTRKRGGRVYIRPKIIYNILDTTFQITIMRLQLNFVEKIITVRTKRVY